VLADLPEPLVREFRLEIARRGTNIKVAMSEAIESWLGKPKPSLPYGFPSDPTPREVELCREFIEHWRAADEELREKVIRNYILDKPRI